MHMNFVPPELWTFSVQQTNSWPQWYPLYRGSHCNGYSVQWGCSLTHVVLC